LAVTVVHIAGLPHCASRLVLISDSTHVHSFCGALASFAIPLSASDVPHSAKQVCADQRHRRPALRPPHLLPAADARAALAGESLLHVPWSFHGALFLLSFDRVVRARAGGHRRGLMSCCTLLTCATTPLGAAGKRFPLLLPAPASLHPSERNDCTLHLQVRACASGWMNRDRWRDEMSVGNQPGGGTSPC